MLSEFCVRRPVSATMLVMSLVVLGTFSFRGLGVDLFPRADPATVSVALSLPGRQPRRDVDVGRRADGTGDQRRVGHRRDSGAHRRGPGAHHRALRPRARSERGRERRSRKSGRRPPHRSADAASARHHEDRSRRRSGHVAHRVVQVDEPANADRAGRQADRPRHPDDQRRRRSEPDGRTRPRDSHRRRYREAQLVRPVDEPGARGRRLGERRDSRRHHRAGQRAAAVAHPRPRRRVGRLQQHRRRHQRRDAHSHRRHRARRGHVRTAHQRGVARRRAGGDDRHPPRDGREHRRRHRRRARDADENRAHAPAWRRQSRSSGTTRGSSTRRSPLSRNTWCSARCLPPSS